MKRNKAETQARCTPDRQERGETAPVAGEAYHRVPAGEYEASCYDVQKGKSWGQREDIYIKFRLLDRKYDGTELFMACTFPKDRKMTPRFKYYKQWTIAAGRKPNKRERLVFGVFKKRLFRILVRDVEKDSNGQPLPEVLKYSVVGTIIEPMTGEWSSE